MRLARELMTGADERLESSTLRELLAVERSLKAVTADGEFDGQVVQWRLDSQAATFILMKGSGNPKLDKIGKAIWATCVRRRTFMPSVRGE